MTPVSQEFALAFQHRQARWLADAGAFRRQILAVQSGRPGVIAFEVRGGGEYAVSQFPFGLRFRSWWCVVMIRNPRHATNVHP